MPRHDATPRDEVEALLRLLEGGPRPRRDLDGALGWSQPTFSRRLKALAGEVLTVGRGPATRYAGRRRVEGVGDEVPLFELDADGAARHVATLWPTPRRSGSSSAPPLIGSPRRSRRSTPSGSAAPPR